VPVFQPRPLILISGRNKEVIFVKYEAPSIIECPKAIDAVQDSTQKTSLPSDLHGMVTVSAYQSDES
jgi:hypothetical protein